MKKFTLIKRIPSYYVGEDCAQIMIGYHDNLTIFNKDGVFFHSYYKRPDSYVNHYLDDERNKQFPYANIPTFNGRKKGQKMTYVNQLFNFDESYVLFGGGGLATEEYVVRDSNEALFIKNVLQPKDNIDLIKRYQLEKLFEKKDDNEKLFFIEPYGGIFNGPLDVLLPNEKTIKEEKVKGEVYSFNNGYPIIMVRINNGEIKIEAIVVDYIKDNCYRINKTDLPLTKYTLNMVKCLGYKIMDMKDIRIPLFGNPNIKRSDVRENKRLVKKLKKEKK